MKSNLFKIGIFGNPNSGKSTLFNAISGSNQKVGNFPGVTVEKKTAKISSNDIQGLLIDFPGTYSLHPNSSDEQIVSKTLLSPEDPDYPEVILFVANVHYVSKQFMLFTQLKDLGFPIFVVLTNCDSADAKDIDKIKNAITSEFNVTVIPAGKSSKYPTSEIKKEILIAAHAALENPVQSNSYFYQVPEQYISVKGNSYREVLHSHYYKKWSLSNPSKNPFIELSNKSSVRLQIEETIQRQHKLDQVFSFINKEKQIEKSKATDRIDSVLANPVLGALFFLVIMSVVFHAIFAWASYPMDAIDNMFAAVISYLDGILPDNKFSKLILSGILPGLNGILVFIPQIAILFFLIGILEESGYMARAVYVFDHILKKFGLNGRSIVALISGGACAIPAIMNTRTIGNSKERLITMMVTPLIPCSARIPVYAALIGFVVPHHRYFGFINSQGLAFTGLYVFGIVTALIAAWVLKQWIHTEERSFLAIQLPDYQLPDFKMLVKYAYDKVKSFVIDAGKIILIISIVLSVLASYGPGNTMEEVRQQVVSTSVDLSEEELEKIIAAKEIEASYAGRIGKVIEPAIAPLGFDWKIGIALITSFAAREVFVGTMATIYSLGGDADEGSLSQRLALEKREDGSPFFDMKTALSLILFYAFAMQCMSTMAVMRRETGGWKWPIIQFTLMGVLAYLSSLIVYQLF